MQKINSNVVINSHVNLSKGDTIEWQNPAKMEHYTGEIVSIQESIEGFRIEIDIIQRYDPNSEKSETIYISTESDQRISKIA